MATSMIRRGSNLRKCVKLLSQTYARSLNSLASTSQVDEDAHYPKVKPKMPPGQWGGMDRQLAWNLFEEGEEVAKLRTYPEKIDQLTKYIYKCFMYYGVDTTPMNLKYKCGVTKTKVVDAMPSLYDDMDVDKEFDILKPIVKEMIDMDCYMNRKMIKGRFRNQIQKSPGVLREDMDYKLARISVKSLFVNLLNLLGGTHQHILNARCDDDSKIAAYWVRDGVERFPLRRAVAPTYIRQNNATFVAEQNVDFHIRKEKPLPSFADINDGVCSDLTYDKSMLEYNPRVFGQFAEQVKREINPGYIIGDGCRFTHLNVIFSNTKAMQRLATYSEAAQVDAEIGYLLSTGFLSTLAQAHGLGFNEYEELTYPLTTQIILTDGKQFSFGAYQLNTTQLWKDDEAVKVQNVLWRTEPAPLFSRDGSGTITNFNDNVFRQLLKCLLIEPSDRNGINLTPNIDSFPVTPTISIKESKKIVREKVVYDRT